MKVLEDDGGRFHLPWHAYANANPYAYRKMHTFTIVRDPLSRLYSAYKYIIAGGNQSQGDIALKQRAEALSSNFESFVCEFLNHDQIYYEPLLQPQYLYTHDRALICQVNSVLRYETLVDDWQHFADAHGLEPKLAHVNRGEEKPLPRLSVTAVNKIKLLYRLDYELFGYEKPVSGHFD